MLYGNNNTRQSYAEFLTLQNIEAKKYNERTDTIVLNASEIDNSQRELFMRPYIIF